VVNRYRGNAKDTNSCCGIHADDLKIPPPRPKRKSFRQLQQQAQQAARATQQAQEQAVLQAQAAVVQQPPLLAQLPTGLPGSSAAGLQQAAPAFLPALPSLSAAGLAGLGILPLCAPPTLGQGATQMQSGRQFFGGPTASGSQGMYGASSSGGGPPATLPPLAAHLLANNTATSGGGGAGGSAGGPLVGGNGGMFLAPGSVGSAPHFAAPGSFGGAPYGGAMSGQGSQGNAVSGFRQPMLQPPTRLEPPPINTAMARLMPDVNESAVNAVAAVASAAAAAAAVAVVAAASPEVQAHLQVRLQTWHLAGC
jgi:hypothetical protein